MQSTSTSIIEKTMNADARGGVLGVRGLLGSLNGLSPRVNTAHLCRCMPLFCSGRLDFVAGLLVKIGLYYLYGNDCIIRCAGLRQIFFQQDK